MADKHLETAEKAAEVRSGSDPGEMRALDHRVATEVMGWASWDNGGRVDPHYWLTAEDRDSEKDCICGLWSWHPSTDIADAWKVVERMREIWAALPATERGEGTFWRFIDCESEGWVATINWDHHDGEQEEQRASAKTLPLAICRAALLATEAGESGA